MKTRNYSDLRQLDDFIDRYEYLKLNGIVGQRTFGSDRWINQAFYRSAEWRRMRNFVIARDLGCDLGVGGFETHKSLIVHHMNPMVADDIIHEDDSILDPEFLISVTLDTHNAIHYGDSSLLATPFVERRPGDNVLWGPRR